MTTEKPYFSHMQSSFYFELRIKSTRGSLSGDSDINFSKGRIPKKLSLKCLPAMGILILGFLYHDDSLYLHNRLQLQGVKLSLLSH